MEKERTEKLKLRGLRDQALNARDIIEQAFSARAVGHTTTLMEGAKNVPNAICITANHRHAADLKQTYPTVKFLGMSSPDKLMGLRAPVVIDHFAIQMMFRAMVAYQEALEQEITELKAK